MAVSPHLGFSLLDMNQASKEVTANAAFLSIDAVLNSSVISRSLTTPPASPSDGDVYIPATGATGAWSGKAGQIAYYIAGNGWFFITPRTGLTIYSQADGAQITYSGGAWGVSGGTNYYVNATSVSGGFGYDDSGNKAVGFYAHGVYTGSAIRAGTNTLVSSAGTAATDDGDWSRAKLPFDITKGSILSDIRHTYTTASGASGTVSYNYYAHARSNGYLGDIGCYGGSAVAYADNTDVWGAALQGIVASGKDSCSAHGMELIVHNYGTNSSTYGLVINGMGTAKNTAALQIQNNIAGGTDCKFLNGIVFNPSPQDPIAATGSLLLCSSGSYGSGIDFGSSSFGNYILNSNNFKIEGGSGLLSFPTASSTGLYESAGSHAFAGVTYTGRYLQVKVNGTARYLPLFA